MRNSASPQMSYKYALEIAALDCPPACASAAGRAVRIVHKPEVPKDYLPSAKWIAARQRECLAWALSMFVDEQTARAKVRKLEKKMRNIRKDIGDHLAVGTLVSTDGDATAPGPDGHMSLFEAAGADLSRRFAIVAAI